METQARAQGKTPIWNVEWVTLGLIAGCYLFWLLSIFWLASLVPMLAFCCTMLLVAFHSSLTHEALHGHPFRSRALNETLMAVPLSLFIPYNRFRDLHLAHHPARHRREAPH